MLEDLKKWELKILRHMYNRPEKETNYYELMRFMETTLSPAVSRKLSYLEKKGLIVKLPRKRIEEKKRPILHYVLSEYGESLIWALDNPKERARAYRLVVELKKGLTEE